MISFFPNGNSNLISVISIYTNVFINIIIIDIDPIALITSEFIYALTN